MNQSSLSSASESMEDSIDLSNPLDNLPSIPVNLLSELKTLSKVAARDPNEETEDETLADLDQLQLDLEHLLSGCVLMTRNLQCTLEGMSDSNMDDSLNGGVASTSGLRGRRKRPKANAYVKKRRGGGAVSTPKINVEIVPELPCTATVAGTPVKAGTVAGPGKTPVKLNGMVNGTHTGGKTPNKNHTKESRSSSLCYIPKNNSAEIFWQSARVFGDPVGDADVKLIEDMLKRYETDTLGDIPPLGKHYMSDPSQLVSSLKKFKSSPNSNGADDSLVLRSEHILLNNNLQLPSNLIHHIVSVLNQQRHNGDENEVPNLESTGTPLVHDSKPVLSGGDTEMSTELVPLNNEMHCDNEEEDEEEDEVLAEIEKCRNELNLVCSENSRMLSSLLSKLVLESRRNKVKQKLDAIDTELCSIVRKMNTARNLAANTSVLHCPQGTTDAEHASLQAKIRRYRKRSLLYLKMRACIVSLLETFSSSQASLFTDSMDIDAYLLKHILEGEEISLSPGS